MTYLRPDLAAKVDQSMAAATEIASELTDVIREGIAAGLDDASMVYAVGQRLRRSVDPNALAGTLATLLVREARRTP